MTVTVGTDSYGDEVGLQAYADKRGITIAGDLTTLLIKSMDYIEVQRYRGIKIEEFQLLEFPRYPTFYGDKNGYVPTDIIAAQYVGAILVDSGATLSPTIERAVKSEKVDVIKVEYMDNASTAPVYTELDSLLSKYLDNSGINSTQFSVGR